MALGVNYLLIDANVWLAFFIEDDPYHRTADQALELLIQQDRGGFITDFVLQEIITILLYRKKIQAAELFLKYIQQDQIELFNLDAACFHQIMTFIQQHHYQPKLSLADWSLLFLAKECSLELMTFDKQLYNAYKKLGV